MASATRDITLRGAQCVVENMINYDDCFDPKTAKNGNFMHFIKTLSFKPILPVMHCNDCQITIIDLSNNYPTVLPSKFLTIILKFCPKMSNITARLFLLGRLPLCGGFHKILPILYLPSHWYHIDISLSSLKGDCLKLVLKHDYLSF